MPDPKHAAVDHHHQAAARHHAAAHHHLQAAFIMRMASMTKRRSTLLRPTSTASKVTNTRRTPTGIRRSKLVHELFRPTYSVQSIGRPDRLNGTFVPKQSHYQSTRKPEAIAWRKSNCLTLKSSPSLGRETFAKRVALSVAVYAVVLAVAALGGNNAMKDAMLSQMQASNKWAYYQAKSTREYVTRVTLVRLEFDRDSLPKEALDKSNVTIKQLRDDVEKYEREKNEIRAGAESLEAERDVALRRDPYFDYAEVLLQIAIVLASVAILARSRLPYLISILLAALGMLACFNGITLLVKVPLLTH